VFNELTRIFAAGTEISAPLPRRGKKIVFIDGGARQGEVYGWDGRPDAGIIDVQLNVDVDRDRMPIPFPNLKGAEIHMFEPNTRNWEQERMEVAKQISLFAECVYVHSVAIWHTEEKRDFYIGIDEFGDLGSTLIKEKEEKLDRDNPLSVQCIDIRKFLKDNFKPEDMVMLKLDIEGAEYDVLPELLKDIDAMTILKSLFVEWHPNFLPQKAAETTPIIISQLSYWHTKKYLMYAEWPY
tara:strand:- start:2974 stop:3690 length:717 start_codon:yes stop_codon:yes gene_type:complete